MNSGGSRPDFGNPSSLMWEISRLAQRLNNIIIYGRIYDTDYEKGKVRVRCGEEADEDCIETDWIPWLTNRSGGKNGGNRTWQAPEKDEQVMVLCPNGNLVNAVVAFSLPCVDNPLVADNADMEKEVWIDHAHAWLEFNRKNWTRRFWLNDKGTFTWGIGTTTEVTMNKERVELRVANTRFIIQDGKVTLSVNDGASEQVWDVNHILAQVAKTGVWELTANQGQTSIGGTGFHTTKANVVEASVNGNGFHRVKETAIESELSAQQVRHSMTADAIFQIVQQSLVKLSSDGKIDLRVQGSSIALESSKVTMTSPLFDGVQGSAQGGQFQTAGKIVYTTPDIPAVPARVALPAHIDGKAPKYPRGDKSAEDYVGDVDTTTNANLA